MENTNMETDMKNKTMGGLVGVVSLAEDQSQVIGITELSVHQS